MSTFFGVQVALDIAPGDEARNRLEASVRELRATTDILNLRSAWSRATDVLRDRIASVRLGSWDLIRVDADTTYDTWASQLEAMVDWPMSDFGDGQLLLATIIAVVPRPSAADRTLGDICDVPERDWQLRSTYLRLLTAVPKLAFGDVRSSGLYVAPRPDQAGFAMNVLTGDGFEYLQHVQG